MNLSNKHFGIFVIVYIHANVAFQCELDGVLQQIQEDLAYSLGIQHQLFGNICTARELQVNAFLLARYPQYIKHHTYLIMDVIDLLILF